jgi:hypothetical protein
VLFPVSANPGVNVEDEVVEVCDVLASGAEVKVLTTVVTGCGDPLLVTVMTEGLGVCDWAIVVWAGVLLVLDAGVDDFDVVSVEEGVLEDSSTEVEVEVDNGGPVVVDTVVASVLAGDGVEVEGGGVSVDVAEISSVVLVEFDILKMRLY